MTRARRIALWIGGSLAGLVVVLVIAAIVVAQTHWFRNFVREKIITVTEESTGGKVDLAAFDFDWTHLRASMRDFVLHGTEPAGAAPLLRAQSIVVDLKLFASLKQYIDIRALTVDTPQANIIVYPDGTTNVPAPKVKQSSDKSALQTVVDLAIGRFDLHNGYATFADRKIPLNAQGRNLRAQLQYNTAGRSYQGAIDINPLQVSYGGKQPLDIDVHVPAVLERDRIQVSDAKIFTPASQLVVNASMQNMNAPQIAAKLNGNLSLAELRSVSGIKISPQAGRTLPGVVNADLAVNMDENRIQLSSARLSLGRSNVEASGTLKEPSGKEAVQFRATLDAGEVGKLFELPQKPDGIVRANGTAKVVGSDYQIAGNIEGRNVAFSQSGQRYRNISLNSAFYTDPHKIALNALKLDAFGGEFAGNAEVLDRMTVKLSGDLRHFDLNTLSRNLTGKPLGYGGVVSGPVELSGDLTKPGVSGFNAKVNLIVAQTRNGLPVSGRLNVNYSGAANNVTIANSYLNLPNSQLQISGSLSNVINVHLTTHDLTDLLPALHVASPSATFPVELARGGTASFDGTITGSTTAPHIAGHLALANFLVEGREFDRFGADFSATSNGASVQNAMLTRRDMQTTLAANVGLKNWKPEPNEPVRANANIRNGDLADILALAGQKSVNASGTLAANAQITGTIGNPQGSANLTVGNGQIEGESFDSIQAQVNLADQLLTTPSATLVAGPAHIDLSASYRHPRDSFTTGSLEARVASNQVQLAQFQSLLKQRPGLAGTAQVNGTLAANVIDVKGQTEARVTRVNGDASVRGLRADGQNYGDLTATARTTGNTVDYRVNSDFAGSAINVSGATTLAPEYPTNATASISNLPVERVLALANRSDIKAKGNLSGNATFHGTLNNPQGTADVTLTKAVLQDEPVDRIQARLALTPTTVEIPALDITAGPNHLSGSGDYTHKPGDYEDGSLRFRLDDSTVSLASVHTVQQYRPGLAGVVRLSADGAATVKKSGNGPEVLLSSLNADVNASGMKMNGTDFGDLRLAANTRGDRLDYKLDSDLAKSKIAGSGETTLRVGYPTTARLTFANVRYSNLRPLLGSTTVAPEFEALAEGQADINGPLQPADQLGGHLELSRLEVTSAPRATGTAPLTIRNHGPIILAMNKSVVNVEQAHLTGPHTDIAVSGTAGLTGDQPLDVKVKANADLSVVQQMSRDIYSSGAVVVDAGVGGTLTELSMNGKVVLQNASFNYIDLPNGISNASGVIVLNGTSATIQQLTGESGGGKIALAGTVSFAGGSLGYNNLRGSAKQVRVRYPPGASIIVSADVALNGTSDHSLLSGNVTIDQLGFSPHSDFGSILASGSTPPSVPAAPSGPIAGMRLDVRIRTSNAASFSSPLAQNLEANADLRLRGTAANPGMIGRVNITSGDLVFFSNKYTVNQGTISFYDPFRINPVLNIDLETIAKGVDVTLNVAGPVDNMKLTYHSDPPLQFTEVVALLATGRTPTSDPTIVANQPATPPQTFQEMGESALVGQAIANPVASRLQRVFGVSQLKIDPTFTSGSELPQARLTLQQQVAPNITFTYITNVTQTNSEILRVEWAIDPKWSAIVQREETGLVGLDFFYKKKIR
jgi:translocation and assembly module TamB